MRTILEILGRMIIGFSNIILLVLGEPYIKDVFPGLAPYSIHIMYTGIAILGMWIVNSALADSLYGHDSLYGYTHKHEQTQ